MNDRKDQRKVKKKGGCDVDRRGDDRYTYARWESLEARELLLAEPLLTFNSGLHAEANIVLYSRSECVPRKSGEVGYEHSCGSASSAMPGLQRSITRSSNSPTKKGVGDKDGSNEINSNPHAQWILLSCVLEAAGCEHPEVELPRGWRAPEKDLPLRKRPRTKRQYARRIRPLYMLYWNELARAIVFRSHQHVCYCLSPSSDGVASRKV